METVMRLVESERIGETEIKSHCFETSGKYNTGARVCQYDLLARQSLPGNILSDEDKKRWANEQFNNFLQLIDSTGRFRNDVPGWDIEIPGTGSGGRYSEHKKSGIACGAGADYDKDENTLSYRLGCTTTPWFYRIQSRF